MSEEKPKYDFRLTRNNNGQPKKDFIPYVEAKHWVNRLGFQNYKQWLRFSKMRYLKGPLKGKLFRPKFIPANPQVSYALRGEWVNDRDFLGERPQRYWPLDEASNFVRSLELSNVDHWRRWHDINKPENIPKFPNVVYHKWSLWKDFLGTTKVNHAKLATRPSLNETMKFMHQFHLQTKLEYQQWVTDNPIYYFHPNPDSYYDDFPGWDTFLGRRIVDRLEIAQSLDVSILYIAHHNHHPENVYEIRVEKKGKVGIALRKNIYRFNIVKMYAISQQEHNIVGEIIHTNGSDWWESEHTYLIRNIHEVLFQLDVLLVSV
jgi:hypothetical protein